MPSRTRVLIITLAAVGALAASGSARAAVVTANQPQLDRWMYPFNGNPGTRADATTFGALGSTSFDERDGQFIVGFDTAALGVPTGRTRTDYRVTSVTVTATHITPDVFAYDPTYDSYTTRTMRITSPTRTPADRSSCTAWASAAGTRR